MVYYLISISIPFTIVYNVFMRNGTYPVMFIGTVYNNNSSRGRTTTLNSSLGAWISKVVRRYLRFHSGHSCNDILSNYVGPNPSLGKYRWCKEGKLTAWTSGLLCNLFHVCDEIHMQIYCLKTKRSCFVLYLVI